MPQRMLYGIFSVTVQPAFAPAARSEVVHFKSKGRARIACDDRSPRPAECLEETMRYESAIDREILKRPVSLLILAVSFLIFLYIRGGKTEKEKLSRARQAGCYDREAIRCGQIWRLLTVGFTHIQPWHIAVNLCSLYNLSFLETVYGPIWYSLILLTAIAAGSLLEYLISDTRYSVGLSGGLYGLMMSWFLVGLSTGSIRIRSVLLTLILNFGINFAPGIAWQAHIGGALSGLLLTEIMIWVRMLS